MSCCLLTLYAAGLDSNLTYFVVVGAGPIATRGYAAEVVVVSE